MTLVHSSEREDFESVLTRFGFLPTDFQIDESPDKTTSAAIYAVTGKIEIMRKSTNLFRSYEAGHGSAWLPQFELELRQGMFGAA